MAIGWTPAPEALSLYIDFVSGGVRNGLACVAGLLQVNKKMVCAAVAAWAASLYRFVVIVTTTGQG
jgi:ATP-dependent protease ClpP protease subunit